MPLDIARGDRRPRPHLFTLDGHTPVPCFDVLEWARWFETANRIVRRDTLTPHGMVSTVFLGADHAFGGGAPILFETMIFGTTLDGYCERCSTWEQAETMHAAALASARAASTAKHIGDGKPDDKRDQSLKRERD